MAVDDTRIPQLASEYPEEKYLNRHVVGEVVAACAHQPNVWRDLGIELLGKDGSTELDKIKANNPGNVTTCCSSMLTIWRQRQPDASWSQLIAALKQVKLNKIAAEIEKRLKSPAEQQDKMVCEMQDLIITGTPNQQQHQLRDQQTKEEDNLHKESSKAVLSSQTHESDANKLKDVVESSSIYPAFTRMMLQIEPILEEKKFSKLRRACVQRINSLGSNLPRNLVPKIQHTATMDEMLDVFSQSPYWNWFDTRLLEALVIASGSPEAEEKLKNFKATFYAKKVTEVIPYVSVKPFKESISVVEKFDKNPKDLTISELLEHKYKLEYEVLDIDEGELVLSCIKTGCVELTWQIPQELVYRAYTSMKRKHDELSSLAVKSLVCEQADEFVGLPILWRGQELGEVDPIEPLPEHVRQEPYSLPQGFHWVTLSSSDVERVAKFFVKYGSWMPYEQNIHVIKHYLTYPNTRSEWQFGIQATSGKLVGIVLAIPQQICIEKRTKTFIAPIIIHNKKYNNKRLFYMLIKELERRTSLTNIHQFLMIYSYNSLFKPVCTMAHWMYESNELTSSCSQLPNSPRTPGWRRMTSEDVPSALALINKWSSQFEIRQVFDSEEFQHNFLQQHIITYVVEDKPNNITDLVSYKLEAFKGSQTQAYITAVVSTQSPVKQLIIDALVCAKESGVTTATIFQHNIEDNVLTSLLFQPFGYETFHFYNYRYHEISQAKFWCFRC